MSNAILNYKPFSDNITKNIDVSSSNQVISWAGLPTGKDLSIRVHNAGTATIFVEYGEETKVAVASTSMAIGPGHTEVFRVGHGGNNGGYTLYFAAIAAGSTGKIYVTPGEGS